MSAVYYQDDLVTIHCADNRDVELPEADLILTDPPYSDKTHAGARTAADWDVSGGNQAPALEMDFDCISEAELDAIFARLAPLARRWVVSFLDYHHTVALELAPPPGLRFVRHGVWVKPNGAPQFTGDRPGTGWESLAILHRDGGRMRWNGGGRHGVWTHTTAHAAHRISDHPNAKPFGLIAQLIKDFSDPGDLVLDPFGGSGVVAAAAATLGRRCVVVEREERHCAALAFWLRNGRPRKVRDEADVGMVSMFDDAAA